METAIFGYTFTHSALLDEALTTPSYRMHRPEAADNQRLEFLGDAVLGLLAADQLFAKCPLKAEGSLTVERSRMVSTAALSAAANRLGLPARLKRNPGAEPLPSRSKTLADAVEAIIGAAWLDGGLAAAKTVFAALKLEDAGEDADWTRNPKGELQILAQSQTPRVHPVYTLLAVSGKAHNPSFEVKVAAEGMGEAVATAKSRKAAEQLAAAKLLNSLKPGAGAR